MDDKPKKRPRRAVTMKVKYTEPKDFDLEDDSVDSDTYANNPAPSKKRRTRASTRSQTKARSKAKRKLHLQMTVTIMEIRNLH